MSRVSIPQRGRGAGNGGLQQLYEELQLEFLSLEGEHQALAEAHQHLETSRERYIELYDFAPIGIATLSSLGVVLNINSTGAALLGHPAEYWQGKPLRPVIAPKDRKSFSEHLKTVVCKGIRLKTEFTCITRTGTAPLLEFTSVPTGTSFKNGELRIRTAFHDVTDLRKAEHLVSEAHAQLTFITDAVPVSIAQCGRDLRYRFVNRAYSELVGRPREEILGRPLAEVLDSKTFRLIGPHVRKVLAGHAVEFDQEIPSANGNGRFLRFAYQPERDLSGAVVGWSTAITDITARRRAEENLRVANSKLEARVRERTAALTQANAALQTKIREHKQAASALRKSEAKLNDFFVQSPLALFWVGMDGRIQRANRAAHGLLECPTASCAGQPISRYFVDPDAGLEALSRLAQKLPLQNLRMRIRTTQGGIRHVLVDANGLWERGILAYSRWFVRDITDRVELEREILAISEREQNRLGQDLHDDLCQRLSAIEYLSQSLAVRLSGTSRTHVARARQIARMLRQSMQHARDLARGLSSMELDRGGLVLALRNLASRTKKMFRTTCHLNESGTFPPVDSRIGLHLYLIAQEAVTNAVKHGHARRIDISLKRRDNSTILSIMDNGIGIPARLRGNKGMGLRVMQYRAGLIEGSLEVKRRDPGGTSVVCVLRRGLQSDPG